MGRYSPYERPWLPSKPNTIILLSVSLLPKDQAPHRNSQQYVMRDLTKLRIMWPTYKVGTLGVLIKNVLACWLKLKYCE